MAASLAPRSSKAESSRPRAWRARIMQPIHCHVCTHINQKGNRAPGRLGQGMNVARSQGSNTAGHNVSRGRQGAPQANGRASASCLSAEAADERRQLDSPRGRGPWPRLEALPAGFRAVGCPQGMEVAELRCTNAPEACFVNPTGAWFRTDWMETKLLKTGSIALRWCRRKIETTRFGSSAVYTPRSAFRLIVRC